VPFLVPQPGNGHTVALAEVTQGLLDEGRGKAVIDRTIGVSRSTLCDYLPA
jgi:hypothetical protein